MRLGWQLVALGLWVGCGAAEASSETETGSAAAETSFPLPGADPPSWPGIKPYLFDLYTNAELAARERYPRSDQYAPLGPAEVQRGAWTYTFNEGYLVPLIVGELSTWLFVGTITVSTEDSTLGPASQTFWHPVVELGSEARAWLTSEIPGLDLDSLYFATDGLFSRLENARRSALRERRVKAHNRTDASLLILHGRPSLESLIGVIHISDRHRQRLLTETGDSHSLRTVDQLRQLSKLGDVHAQMHLCDTMIVEPGLTLKLARMCAKMAILHPTDPQRHDTAISLLLGILRHPDAIAREEYAAAHAELGFAAQILGMTRHAVYHYQSVLLANQDSKVTNSMMTRLLHLGHGLDERIHWPVVTLEQATVRYSPRIDETRRAEHEASMEEALDFVSDWFDWELREPLDFHVYLDQAEGERFGEDLSYAMKRLGFVHMIHTINPRHEVVHAVLNQIEEAHGWSMQDLVIQEGLATFLEDPTKNWHDAGAWNTFLFLGEEAPLSTLRERWPKNRYAYPTAASLVKFLLERDESAFRKLIFEQTTLDAALQKHFGMSEAETEQAWLVEIGILEDPSQPSIQDLQRSLLESADESIRGIQRQNP